MTRIVGRLTFSNWDDAQAAADELRRHDYEVEISTEMIDDCSNAAFAETYKTVAGREQLDAVFEEISKIIDPFDGFLCDCGEAGADYIPFNY
jgi:hypothetical protein